MARWALPLIFNLCNSCAVIAVAQVQTPGDVPFAVPMAGNTNMIHLSRSPRDSLRWYGFRTVRPKLSIATVGVLQQGFHGLK